MAWKKRTDIHIEKSGGHTGAVRPEYAGHLSPGALDRRGPGRISRGQRPSTAVLLRVIVPRLAT